MKGSSVPTNTMTVYMMSRATSVGAAPLKRFVGEDLDGRYA